jgi:hypothetical protein
MPSLDTVTWQVLALLLTVVGVAISVLLWRTRGPAAGTRGLAWSLLPLAAYLTGVLRLAWEIADALVDWAVRLVFSPTVWLGIALAGVSVMLFMLAAMLRRRGTAAAGGRRRAKRSELPGARSERASAAETTDLDDIEAILKKHGIS